MRIFGAKGGGGGGHTPVEAPETGRSKQIVNIVEVISEGEITGLVDGMKSIYLDNTPVQNADDSYNFNNVSGELNIGTQDQGTLSGYESSQNEVNVGVEVKKATGAIVRTITDERITRLRFTLGVKALYQQNDQGDTNPTSVNLQIKVGEQVYDHTISGKYSSQYLEMLVIDNLPSVPFNISVERVTADSNKNTLQNGTIWSSYTEIIDTEFTYPNTAVAGVSFDSDYFNGIPARNYLIKGIKVRVPSNYDPETRAYDGMWDGTFKIAWTNNPAWILFDVITNSRYGLGNMLGSFSCDKWTLYDIARYCDVMVDDGFGGKEPRFTCNAWITDIDDAYKVINNICSIFRAIPVWTGSEFSAIIDRPTDPSWVYTNANVKDGKFERSYSAKKSRHNAVKVSYADKTNGYQSAVEYVSDDESIAKNGLNLTEITAFGCTSRGQAHRTGRWLIETEKLEKETITFTVGREGLMHLPGDIIRVNDNDYAGTNIGGRVLAVNGSNVTLDREIELSSNSFLTYINNSAKENTIRITAVSGNTVTLASSPVDLGAYSVWALTTETVKSGLYKAISLTENEDGTFTITALQHEPQKEAIVDKSAHFVPTTKTAYRAPQINDVGAKTGYDGKLYVTVDVGSGDGEVTFDVRITKDGKLYEYRRGLTDPNISFEHLPNGEYTVVIYAKNRNGQVVSEKTTTFTIDKPPVPTGVIVTGGLGEITIEWDWVDDATYTEIFASEDETFANAVKVAKVLSKLYSHSVGAHQTRYYWLRHVRGINNGPFYQGIKGESAVDLDEKLEELNKELSKNIIDEVFDTAAPARGLEMIKTVNGLDVNTFLGYRQVHNTADGKLYTWNGTVYVADSGEIFANEIKGIIQPEQLAPIPTTNLAGKLTDEQIQSINATKVIGTLSLTNMPTIPTSKLSGQLTDSQLQGISANKITGTIAVSQLASIPTTKLTGTISANQISANSIGTNAIQAGAIGATHLQSGSVGASQIQANAISSNAIQSGAVVAGKIATNAVVADNIATNAITAVKISAGAITAEKLSANSVGANAIQANAIVAGKIAANAVTTATIAAGAIRANHVAAGELTADKLAIGLGGNLLYNPIFSNNAYGWGTIKASSFPSAANINQYYNRGTVGDEWTLIDGLENEYMRVVRINGTDFKTNTSVELHANSPWFDIAHQTVSVIPNKWYIYSAYIKGYNCAPYLLVEEYTNKSTYKGIVAHNRNWGNSGSAQYGLQTMTRTFVKFKAPASGLVSIRCRAMDWVGNSDYCDIYMGRPMLEECTEYTKEPSPWQNSGVTAIHGGSIVTNTITAQQMAANTITANEIASGAIATRHLSANSVNAGHIVSKSLTADKLNVSTLSAISANMGNITAGSLNIGSGKFVVSADGTLTAQKGTFSGSLQAASGTFSGTLQAAGGTFSGTVQAAKILGDVVKAYTIPVNGSVTVPAQDFARKLIVMSFSIAASSSDGRKVLTNAVVYFNEAVFLADSVSSSGDDVSKIIFGSKDIAAGASAVIKYTVSSSGTSNIGGLGDKPYPEEIIVMVFKN